MWSKAFAALSIAWLLLLVAAVAARQQSRPPVWTTALYAAASRICHQRPERSFFTGGVQWPVCGRCSGLYAAAPIGALVALRRRRQPLFGERVRWVIGLASVPTVLSVALELGGAHVTTLARMMTAWPLGAALGWTLTRVVADDARSASPTRAQM